MTHSRLQYPVYLDGISLTTPNPSTNVFSPNSSATILVPVTVPAAALRSQIDTITVTSTIRRRKLHSHIFG